MGTKLVEFKVEMYPKMRVIGKGVVLVEGEMKPEDHQIEDLWESMARDGSFDILAQLPGHVGPKGDMVGWMGDFHPPDMHFTYVAGALFEPSVEAPEGYLSRDIEAGEMAVSRLQNTEGPEGGEMHAAASGINGQEMAAHGYEYDGSRGLYEMEYQSHELFYIPLERGEQPVLDFYSPCKKKSG
ncbi:MAG: GyrI-like domain-containing protein [Anaerolineae bacterium]|nr:GyrI-like domain-containing protein [Anaerolineae bacterium]